MQPGAGAAEAAGVLVMHTGFGAAVLAIVRDARRPAKPPPEPRRC